MISKLMHDGAAKLPGTVFRRYLDNAVVDRAASTALSASEAGSCERQLYLNRMNPELKAAELAKKWGILQRGNTAEAFIVRCLRMAEHDGWELRFMGAGQRTFFSECGLLSGTPDLVMFKGTHALVVDFKCIDPRTYKAALPKSEHVAQVVQNMELIFQHFEHLETVSGAVLYVDAADYSDHVECEVQYDEALVDSLYEKARRLNSVESAGETEPEGLNNPKMCKYCLHYAECSALTTGKKGTTNDETTETTENRGGAAKTGAKSRTATFREWQADSRRADVDAGDGDGDVAEAIAAARTAYFR